MLLSAQLYTVTSCSSSSSAAVSSSGLHRHFLHNHRLNIKMDRVTWCFYERLFRVWPRVRGHLEIQTPNYFCTSLLYSFSILFATRLVSPCWPKDRMQVFDNHLSQQKHCCMVFSFFCLHIYFYKIAVSPGLRMLTWPLLLLRLPSSSSCVKLLPRPRFHISTHPCCWQCVIITFDWCLRLWMWFETIRSLCIFSA